MSNHCTVATNWLSVSVPASSVTACCKHELRKVASVDFQSEHLVSLRRDLDAGVRPAECTDCWLKEDSSGVGSSLRTRIPILPHKELDTIEVKLGDACDSGCHYCGPGNSQHRRKFFSQEGSDLPETGNKQFLYDSLSLIVNSPSLRKVKWIGGEVTLMPTWYSSSIYVAANVERVITQTVTTNANYTQKILRNVLHHYVKLAQYAHVQQITVSGEGSREYFNLMRSGSDYDTVMGNIKYLADTPAELQFQPVLNSISVWSLAEFLSTLRDNVGPNRELNIVVLTYPQDLRVHLLGHVASRQLRQIVDELKNWTHPSARRMGEILSNLASSLDSVPFDRRALRGIEYVQKSNDFNISRGLANERTSDFLLDLSATFSMFQSK